MSTDPLASLTQTRNLVESYQQVQDLLTAAYWEATDMGMKDMIYSVEHEIGDIITQLNTQQVDNITSQFIALKPKIDATNTALKQIKDEVNQITKNISTASKIVAAISKVITMLPA